MKYGGVIVLLLVVATLMALPSKSSAQNFEANDYADSYYAQYEDNGTKRKNITLATRNDIRIGAGVPGGTSMLSLQGFLLGITGSSHFAANDFFRPETTYITPISFEYNHYRNEWLVIGVKAHFSAIEGDIHAPESGAFKYRAGHYLVGVLFNWRFEYLRREYVQLYSSCGVGVGVRITKPTTLTLPVLMVDWTYIGVTFGKRVFGYAEFGGGVSGFLRAGIGGRF